MKYWEIIAAYHSRPNGESVGNQIDAVMILARADFVNALRASHHSGQRLAPVIG
jgi:hypothetical protein